jgi:hypothetical protein
MKHQESKSAILLRHYLKANPYHTCSIETKDTRGKDSLLFSEVKEAQLDWGMAIKSDKGVLIRTQAVSEGMPDYIYLRNEPAVIVIKYPSILTIIDVETFILEKKRSKRKSLTSTRAQEIAIKVIKNTHSGIKK